MEATTVVDRLVELLVILVAAKAGAEIMARLRQPAVIGELVMGMVVGASVLGWVDPAEGGVVRVLAEIGVILLLFEVGLETDLREFGKVGPRSALVALIGVATPFALGFGAAKALGLAGGSTEVAIFTGAAMTATSVGITARVLGDLGKLDTPEGRTIIGAAVIDDVIGLIILAVVAGLLGEGGFSAGLLASITIKAVVFLAATVAIGVLVVPFYFRFLERLRVEGSFVVGAFVFAIAVGLAAEKLAGLEPIVGAFAAGLVAGEAPQEQRIGAELRPINHLFVPIFFLAIGAQVDVGVLFDPAVLVAGAVISVLAIVGKLVAGAGVVGTGMRPAVVGVGMVPRGEVGLIFAALGAEQLSGVVGGEENAIVVMMVIVTTLLAPIVLNRLLAGEAGPPEPVVPGSRADIPTVGGPEIAEAEVERLVHDEPDIERRYVEGRDRGDGDRPPG